MVILNALSVLLFLNKGETKRTEVHVLDTCCCPDIPPFRGGQQGLVLATERLLEELHTLQEATLFYPASNAGAARISYCLVRPTATQKDLLRLLDLQKHTHQPATDSGN